MGNVSSPHQDVSTQDTISLPHRDNTWHVFSVRKVMLSEINQARFAHIATIVPAKKKENRRDGVWIRDLF